MIGAIFVSLPVCVLGIYRGWPFWLYAIPAVIGGTALNLLINLI